MYTCACKRTADGFAVCRISGDETPLCSYCKDALFDKIYSKSTHKYIYNSSLNYNEVEMKTSDIDAYSLTIEDFKALIDYAISIRDFDWASYLVNLRNRKTAK